MLEDKRMIKTVTWASRAIKNNGTYGVDGFIQANTASNSKRNKFGIFNARTFNSGKPIIWNGKFINPDKLNISNLTLPKITTKSND